MIYQSGSGSLVKATFIVSKGNQFPRCWLNQGLSEDFMLEGGKKRRNSKEVIGSVLDQVVSVSLDPL